MGRTTAPPIGLGCSHTCLGVRGEVCIVEPWFTPEVWENGRLTADLVDQPSLKIARVLVSGREQSVATLAIHYLVAQPEGVETFAEQHRLGLFTHEEYLAAFRAAKLAVTYDPVGLLGRELYKRDAKPTSRRRMDAAALPSLPTDSDLEAFMREALREAEMAAAEEELPIGAVVVIDGLIVARGHARHRQLRSQLAHAELQALLAGGEALWRDFDRAMLITTVEPCPMCLGAAVMADVPHVVFAAPDAAMHSRETVASNPYVRRHIKTYRGGVLEAEARALIARFAPEMLSHS